MKRITILAILVAVSSAVSAHMMNGNMGGSVTVQKQASDSDDSASKGEGNQEGHAQVQTFCAGCHQPPNPGQHTPQEWPQVVERMQSYMQKQRRRLPNSSEVKHILQYLDNSQEDN
jgi:cytochrome c553